jgi:hypothetical protein
MTLRNGFSSFAAASLAGATWLLLAPAPPWTGFEGMARRAAYDSCDWSLVLWALGFALYGLSESAAPGTARTALGFLSRALAALALGAALLGLAFVWLEWPVRPPGVATAAGLLACWGAFAALQRAWGDA